jgi:hypothetical protein
MAAAPAEGTGRKAVSSFRNKGGDGEKQRETAEGTDVATGKPVQTLAGEDDNQFHALAISGDGKRLAACFTIGPAQVWDLGSGKRLTRPARNWSS